MSTTSSKTSNKGNKAGNIIGSIVSSALGLAIAVLIGVWVYNIGGYLFNSKKEMSEVNIPADIGGGLYIGASESSLSSYYRFGDSDKAYGGVHYETTKFTEIYGMRFDKADVVISTPALRSFDYLNNGGNGRLSSITLEKKGSSKELRKFVKNLISNVRKEAGLSGANNEVFYRHYTLIMPERVVEIKYEGYFSHYVNMVVLTR